MNKLTRTLLGGAALAALAAVPAAAQTSAPRLHFATLHGGHVVNKTKLHNHGATHITYTFGIYTYVPAADYRKTVPLKGALLYETYSPCTVTWQKIEVPKKSEHAKLGSFTETTSGLCGDGVKTVYYGPTYKLTDPDAKGKTDEFVSSVIGKFEYKGTKYKAKMNLDVQVFID